MPEVVSDNFNRANSGTLGVNWTKLSAFSDVSIVSNQAKGTAAADPNLDRYTGAGWTGSNTDQYAEITIGTMGSFPADEGGPTVRTSGANDCYILDLYGPFTVFALVGGTYTNLGGGPTTPVAGETWRIEVQGATITSKRNGITEASVSDSSIASGLPGLYLYNTIMTAESWAAGDFSGGAPLMALIGEPLVGSSIF